MTVQKVKELDEIGSEVIGIETLFVFLQKKFRNGGLTKEYL